MANTKKSNQLTLKKDNRLLLLNMIRSHEPLSRADLSRLTDLTKVTVSSLVDELVQCKLVVEIGNGESRLGRKPVLLSLNGSKGYVLGVEIAPQEITMICMDLSYHVIKRSSVPNSIDRAESLLMLISNSVGDFIKSLELPFPMLAIGVAVMGFVDFDSGVVINAVNMPLTGIHLGDWLSETFRVPVYVDNEANTAAWGEYLFGTAKKAQSVAFISAGYGIGMGFIYNGQLYRGASGLAGEVGHMTIVPDGTQCSCGNHGCWEMYASEKYLRRFCLEHGLLNDNNRQEVDIVPWLTARVETGDPIAHEAIRSIGRYIGIGVANIANTLNPALIVLGNKLAFASPWIMPVVRMEVRKRCLDPVVERLRLTVSTQGELAVVKGAAALAVEHCVHQLCNALP